MGKTKIDWANYSYNPVRGICNHFCSYCYARKMYERFKWDDSLRFDFDALNFIDLPEPQKIFIGSMHDVFGNWVFKDWIDMIINAVLGDNLFRYAAGKKPNMFIFLTKNPKRYLEFVIPRNCWLGVTLDGSEGQEITDNKMGALLLPRHDHHIKFISFEPLLNSGTMHRMYIPSVDWIIIGGLTPKPVHTNEMVQGLLTQARVSGVPIFVKKNLHWPVEIKEFPEMKNEY